MKFASIFILLTSLIAINTSQSLDHRKFSIGLEELNSDRYKSKFTKDLEQLMNILEDDKDDEKSEFIPLRRKKNRYTPDYETCSSRFKHETNVIVDSKTSIKNGAELINPIRYISKEKASEGLNALQNTCMKKCCDNDKCDTALLSMKVGLDGYRCYLFKCNQNCFFIKHNDYIVLRMRSPEQMNQQEQQIEIESKPQTKTTTKNPRIDDKKPSPENNFNSEMMGGSNDDNDITSNLNDKNNKIYFTDKSYAVTSTANITLATFFLVAGISVVIMLFTYLIMSTKFMSKRFSRLRENKKNVDVDGDYLINGMYL